MLNSFFSFKCGFNSVNQYLIKGYIITLAFIILNSFPLFAIKYEITNNFSNYEAQQSSNNEFRRFDDTELFLFADYNYKNYIGTVQFSPTAWEMGPALIRMNSQETLLLQFDDLDADYKNYYYTIVHCDAHWNPSPLMDFEYIDGYNQDQIVDYSFSINTIVQYTHYTLEFPNRNMRPMISGNYLLKVFLDGNTQDVVFTRRFMVYEQLVPVTGTAHFPDLVVYRDTRHQLAFTLNTAPYHISNPYQDLKIVVQQNGRWDNAIIGLTPRMIQGNMLIYDYEDKLLFEGGNEFRRFDTRSLRYVSERINDISTGSQHWDVFLLPDEPRQYRRFTSQDDLNGRFHIQTHDASDDDIGADYAWVHFNVPMDAPLHRSSVHIMGDLTNWVISPENEMTYNHRLRQYETSLLLKQGLYNYWYVVQEEGAQAADVCFIEGCHSQTENEYSVFVYHRPPGNVTDRLVGMANFNSAIMQR